MNSLSEQKSTCGSCYYEWITGQDGSHSCVESLQKEIRRQDDRIKQLESQLEWQPIETAPRDGTKILACSTKERVRTVTWWRSKKDRAGYIGWGEFNSRLWPAEFWMPLQKLPKGE